MNFRKRYRADFGAVEPGERLLASVREMAGRPKAPRRFAAAVLTAACLLLAVSVMPAPSEAGAHWREANPQTARSISQPTPQAEAIQDAGDRADRAVETQLSSFAAPAPLMDAKKADYASEAAKFNAAGSATRTVGILAPDLAQSETASDWGWQPAVYLELLEPAPDGAVRLAKCGLLLARLTLDTPCAYDC